MKILNKLLVFTAFAGIAVSCADLDTIPEGWVITEDQKSEIAEIEPERLYADVVGMFAYMGQQFAGIPSNTRDDDMGYFTHAHSEDLNGPDMGAPNVGYNWFTVASDYTDRSPDYANPVIRWRIFWYQMKMANDLIKVIPADTENEKLKWYKGMAHAVRAFDYFSLVQKYQFTYVGNEEAPGVPVVTEESVDGETSFPRMPVDSIYKIILSDLDLAIDLLDGYDRQGAKNLIDKSVAYGIRARVNLVLQNWNEAYADADEALTLGAYRAHRIDEVSVPAFYETSEPWMWTIYISVENLSSGTLVSWPSKLCSFSGNSYSAGAGVYKYINRLLYDKIPDGDVRKGWWVNENLQSPLLDGLSWGDVSGQAIAPLVISEIKEAFLPYTNVKFGNAYPGDTDNASDWCLMRAEEMMLIKAEAAAMGGDLAKGIQELERFVQTYRFPGYTYGGQNTATAFQNEVWFQRRVELWGEGFASTDMMRLKKPLVRIKAGVESNLDKAFQFNMSADDGYMLMRIPQSEINSNAGINAGDQNSDGSLPVAGQNAGLTDGVTD